MIFPLSHFRAFISRSTEASAAGTGRRIPVPGNETQRLASLGSYDLVGSNPDPDLNHLVQLAGQQCGTSIALISLLETDRQWFLAKTGLDVNETPRDQAFCSYTIMSDQLMIVEDAQRDARFRDNPLVTGYPNIRFYAGMPLINGEGYALGSLCVIDQNPRTLTEAQAFCLAVLARQLVHFIELRKKVRQYQQAQQCLKAIASMQSHQVRGSLSSILGLLQLINQEGLSEENKEYVALLNATARKMDHTISTIVHTSSEEICQA